MHQRKSLRKSRSRNLPKNHFMENITNLIRVKSNPKLKISPEGDFFRVWVEFLKPVHKLTNREMDVLAVFLKRRYELGKVITDADVLDRVLMSEETKLGIRKECDVSPKHFQVIMARFRKNGVVKDNKICLPLIPTITGEGVGLMVYFSFDDEQRIKLGH
jgi:hypothetical protein